MIIIIIIKKNFVFYSYIVRYLYTLIYYRRILHPTRYYTNDLLIDRFIMILSIFIISELTVSPYTYLYKIYYSTYIFCTGSFSIIIDISSYYQIRATTLYNFKNKLDEKTTIGTHTPRSSSNIQFSFSNPIIKYY